MIAMHVMHAMHAMHAMRAMHVMTLPGYFRVPGYPVACRSPMSWLQFVTRSLVTLARLQPSYYPLLRKPMESRIQPPPPLGWLYRIDEDV